MQLFLRSFFAILPLCAGAAALSAPPATQAAPAAVTARIETTLPTRGEQVRQLAFDGDSSTFFESAANVSADDHFTLAFDQPVTIKAIDVATGDSEGNASLTAGSLEISEDGKSFQPVNAFTDGAAHVQAVGKRAQAVRIKASAGQQQPLAIREIAIESDPPLARFKYPVEFVVDVDDAPEMKPWAEKTARVCERAYPMLNEELKSEGFTPPRLVKLTISRRYRGIAATSGSHIVASARYFEARPDDVGAIVHETAHVVQQYKSRQPTWLIEGIADYVRYFKFEPGTLGPMNPEHAHYSGSYGTTATFLAYVAQTHDERIVLKLNKLLREGQYTDEAFKQLAGKTLDELDRDWRASLSH